ncbi:EpsG family protein [Methylocystis sp. H62]|uniref:EpsG family protein n=1 Tax=Methylocystis sp. H62 TaxID=2785789 RepID=UPI0018C1EC98|nr:EpsG family protein [Methylocystis sp. H62]MBG0792646.1 EpsG family protein [Methylocystis sp. H62]
MWPYWVMFLLPACAALNSAGSRLSRPNQARGSVIWVSFGIFLALLIGFRYQVGGDWGSYLKMLKEIATNGISTKLDPGYGLLNSFSLEMDWGIFGVNVIGGAIFTLGLMRFCRAQPRPWLALAVAVPYLVVVVAMGYTRQAIALGAAMLGLVALGNKSNIRFAAWVLLGATFHKSAVLLLPLAALATARSRLWTVGWIAVITAGAYKLLLEKDAESLYVNYVVADYQSEGAMVRLLMNALPAVIFLVWRQKFQFAESERRLWTWVAIFSLGMLGVFAVTTASAAIDRIALYMLPLQLAVFSRLPDAIGVKVKRRLASTNSTASSPRGELLPVRPESARQLTAAVLLYYSVVLFVWLNFATHAGYWLPYRFYLLEF